MVPTALKDDLAEMLAGVDSPDSMRAVVTIIADRMRLMPQLEIPTKHYFSRGVYAREITIPRGARVVGKTHKYENLNTLSKGDISVLTEDGFVRVQAPFTVVSPPGTKRIAIAHTECVWTTYLGTDKKDSDEIEHEFTAVDEEEYLSFCQRKIAG